VIDLLIGDFMEDILEKMAAVYGDVDGDNDHAWGVPVKEHNLTNLSDEEYLTTILGPRRMGYQVWLSFFKHLLSNIDNLVTHFK
jgi:hypothetical protein